MRFEMHVTQKKRSFAAIGYGLRVDVRFGETTSILRYHLICESVLEAHWFALSSISEAYMEGLQFLL
jgi:hypothetical protein